MSPTSTKAAAARAMMALGVLALLTAAKPALASPAEPGRVSAQQEAQESTVRVQIERGTLHIFYAGPIVKGMAEFLATTFNKHREASHRVVLYLVSGGGSIEEGEQVIHVLKEIKLTHRLDTAVMHGDICASMCVPIYLQGKDRYAARSSLWVFHEAAKTLNKEGSKVKIDEEETLRLFRRYYLQAGVSVDWIKQMLHQIEGGRNYWQTGQDLIAAQSGIITDAVENVTSRPEARPATQR